MLRLLAGLVFTVALGVAAAEPGPVVRTAAGAIRGEGTPEGGAVFKGIPYAAAPVGALRWAAPVPAAGWAGVRDGSAYGPPCVQVDQGWNSADAARGSEDCLYLNVWTPKSQAGGALPVLVWIHGGGFMGGSGDSPVEAGGRMAAHGVMVVSVNYRLGVLGFLALPELRSGDGAASTNFGLLDQIAALRWVKANIGSFGGDPGRVTIAGQSAGGMAVLDLMASPMAKGLVRGAVIESGVAVPILLTPALAVAEEAGERFAAGMTVAQMRGMSTAEVMRRYGAFSPQAMVDWRDQFLPVVDGTVLPEDPHVAFAEGRALKVPLLIGSNAKEGPGAMTDEALPGMLAKRYGAEAPAALRVYGYVDGRAPAVDPVMGSAAKTWLTDSSMRCGAVMTAKWQARAGAAVYAYQFEQSLPSKQADGAAHGYELPYVFGNLLPTGNLGSTFGPADRALAETMMRYWSDFVKTGDPNGAGMTEWPRFESGTRGYVRFSTAFPSGVRADVGLRREACDLYERSLGSR